MITRRMQYEIAGRITGPVLMAMENYQLRQKRRKQAPKENPYGPPLETDRKMKDLMSIYYYKGRWADGAVPVAWVTSGFPIELLRAFDFYSVYPENHAALCAARHQMPELAGVAEDAGYSRDICAYARTDIGSFMSGKTPLGRLPKPDLVAACSNICQTVLYWFRTIADHFGVPFFVLDTPYVYGDFKDHQIDYVKDQLGELAMVASEVSGRPVSEQEMQRTAELGNEGSRLWGECLNMSRIKPAPWTAFDHFYHMAPIVTIRGTEACNAFYRELLDELKDRADRGIGGLKNERYRLLWDNIAIWPKLRFLSLLFASNGFNFVTATYTNGWREGLPLWDPDDRLASSAKMLSNALLNRDLKNRYRVIKELVNDFSVDGVVLHSDRSCKPYSVGQYDLKDELTSRLGVKVAVIEADHADPRQFAEEQIETRLQAFMESFG
jgi:benzoyl-CoA reductase/2-hydroxyglutaryl-CoA dehydratase subunit BcrC/BadD/HgdB